MKKLLALITLALVVAACADAGLIFVGPAADTIRRMGSKAAAKALMEKSGVPVVPGYHGDEQDTPFSLKHATSHR